MLVFLGQLIKNSSAFLHSSYMPWQVWWAALGDKIAANILAQNCQGTIHSLEWRWLDLWAHWWRGLSPRARAIGVNRVTLRRIFFAASWTRYVAKHNINAVARMCFNKAMVTSAEEACERAEKIGFPIMVKASEGRPQGWRRNIYILYFFSACIVYIHIYIYVQVRYGTIFLNINIEK